MGREQRDALLDPAAKQSFAAMERDLRQPGYAAMQIDKQTSAIWLAARLNRPEAEVQSNFDHYASNYFGRAITPGAVYDEIVKYEQDQAALLTTPPPAPAGGQENATNADAPAKKGFQFVRTFGAAFEMAGQQTAAGTFSMIEGALNTMGGTPKRKSAFDDPAFLDSYEQLRGLEKRGLGETPEAERLRNQTEFAVKAANADFLLRKEEFENGTIRGAMSSTARQHADFFFGLSDTARARYGVDEEFRNTAFGWIAETSGDMIATSALMAAGSLTMAAKLGKLATPGQKVMNAIVKSTVNVVGSGRLYASVTKEREKFLGENYANEGWSFAQDIVNAGGQQAVEMIPFFDNALEKALRFAPKVNGRVSFGEALRQFPKIAAHSGAVEAAEGVSQKVWSDFIRDQGYDDTWVDLDNEKMKYAKALGVEAFANFAGGVMMAGIIQGPLIYDQNNRAKKAERMLTAKDGGLYSARDFQLLREARSDEEISGMAMGDVLLKAVNGDVAAMQQYNKEAAKQAFKQVDGMELVNGKLGEVDSKPAFLDDKGDIYLFDLTDAKQAAQWDKVKDLAVRWNEKKAMEGVQGEQATSEMVSYITQLQSERGGLFTIDVGVKARSILDQVGGNEERAQKLVDNYIKAGALPEGSTINSIVQGASSTKFDEKTHKFVTAIQIAQGANPLVVLEESAHDYFKRQIELGEFTEATVHGWRSQVEAGWEGQMNYTELHEWLAKYAVGYAMGKVQAAEASALPVSFKRYLERFAKFFRESLEFAAKVMQMERDNVLPVNFLRALQEATGTVDAREAGAYQEPPLMSELDKKEADAIMQLDSFPKIEGNDGDGWTVTDPAGDLIANALTVEDAQDRAMDWWFTQEQKAERAAALQEAGHKKGNELMDVIRSIGGLRAVSSERADSVFGGELAAIAENMSTYDRLRTFRKNGKDLDYLIQDLKENGFDFATPADLLAALDKSTRGNPVYPTWSDEGGQSFNLASTEPALWDSGTQEITSAKTSINQSKMPATFLRVEFAPGTRNADIGGGAFDNATEYLKGKDVENVIFDPFNRSKEANDAAVAKIRDGQSDTATVNNVLNVIQEPNQRSRVIAQAANAIKPDGTAYFLIYEGNADGAGKKTKIGTWQENRKTADYIDEIGQYFSDVKKAGNLLVATGPQTDTTMNKERAVPADASNVVEMPDGARLIGPTTFSIKAFHGTPYKVGKFSMDKIGTGEGVQAYGWGLYFAKSKDVAMTYQPRNDKQEAAMMAEYKKSEAREDYVAMEIWESAMLHKLPVELVNMYTEANGFDPKYIPKAKAIADKVSAILKKTGGALYTVELLPNEDEFLDWDKPLSEQSEKVKAAVAAYIKGLTMDERERFNYQDSNQVAKYSNGQISGAAFYNCFNAPAASRKLAELGIPGIRYLDAGSRSTGKGTSNYVIFDENLIQILEENGQPVKDDTVLPDPKTVGELNRILDAVYPMPAIGETRTFFRAGTLPKSGKSFNYRDQTNEIGVSVYATPFPDSLAGMTGRDWYSGTGTVVGFGSDGEPLIKPIGEWAKFFDAKSDLAFGNAANKWAIEAGLIRPMAGQQTFALTPVTQTETPEFNAWFAGSKVVDAQGKPLVVVHGTAGNFTRFDSNRVTDGFWFTSNRAKIESGESGAGSSGRIMEVYLSAKKLAGWDEYDRMSIAELRREGFDGVKLDDDYLVFEPTQIKSATDNSGTFDATNPDITFAMTPGTPSQPAMRRESPEMVAIRQEVDAIMASQQLRNWQNLGIADVANMQAVTYVARVKAAQDAQKAVMSGDVVDQMDRVLMTYTSAMDRLIPGLGSALQRLTFAKQRNAARDKTVILALAEKIKALPNANEVFLQFQVMGRADNRAGVEGLAKLYGFTAELAAAEYTLAQIRRDSIEAGVPVSRYWSQPDDWTATDAYRKDIAAAKSVQRGRVGEAIERVLIANGFTQNIDFYWPSKVFDKEGLDKWFGTNKDARVVEAYRAVEAAAIKAGRSMTEEDLVGLISTMVNGGRRGKAGPGSLKQRTIANEAINIEVMQFYYNAIEAALLHVESIRTHIQQLDFFGKSVQLDERNDTGAGVPPIDLAQSARVLFATQAAGNQISPAKEEALTKLIVSRFEPNPGNRVVNVIRALGYVMSLGQVYSGQTATLDALAIGLREDHLNPLNTFLGLIQAATGKSTITLAEAGIDTFDMGEDFQSTQKWEDKMVRWVFKHNLLTRFSRLYAQAGLNQALKAAQRQARSGDMDAVKQKRLERLFGTDGMVQVMADLAAGRKTDDTLLYAFATVANYQPISPDQQSQFMRSSSTGKMIFQFKSFLTVQISGMRDDAYNEIRSGDPKRVLNGTRFLLALAATLLMVGLPGDLLRSWLTGRTFILSDQVAARLLGLIGLSPYLVREGKRSGPSKVIASLLIPSVGGAVDDLVKDVFEWEAVMTSKADVSYLSVLRNMKVWQNAPLLGKIYDDRYGYNSTRNEKNREDIGWFVLTDPAAADKAEQKNEATRKRLEEKYSNE